jgi:hypothetical protein
MLCEHCNKPLRHCKRVDVVDRTIHFSCIKKIKKERYEEALEKLRNYLERKNIRLIQDANLRTKQEIDI